MSEQNEFKDVSEILFRDAQPLSASPYPIPPYKTETIEYKKGSINKKGAKPLAIDLELLKDQPVPMRDGVNLAADVYRQKGASAQPTILVFTPYSKEGGTFNTDYNVTTTGVKQKDVSGLQLFEAADPDYWCQHGYNLVICDARGMGQSDGDYRFMGHAQGIDVYDTTEWIASQPWATGKTAMVGNSQLGMIQWAAASENPPHLTAIAPWEGLTDVYRDVINRGGIPNPTFHDVDILGFVYGKNKWEDITAMLTKYPTQNDYWRDKIPEIEKINIPAYVVASWTHPIHTHDTIRAYQHLTTTDKWLRIHNTQEWPDLYDKNNLADLRKFMDHYLKGENNGWENTPKVRYTVLDQGAKHDTFRSANSYPGLPVETKELFLDANTQTMSETPVEKAGSVTYDATTDTEYAHFEWKSPDDLEIHGCSNLRLKIETDKGTDMDLFGAIYKKDASGKVRYHIVFPAMEKKLKMLMLVTPASKKLPGGPIYAGPVGRLRVSHRALDESKSTDAEPYLSHENIELIEPKQVVEVNLGMWPTGMFLRKGETLVVEIGGKIVGPIAEAQASDAAKDRKVESVNEGHHTIHTGGKMQSKLFIELAKTPK